MPQVIRPCAADDACNIKSSKHLLRGAVFSQTAHWENCDFDVQERLFVCMMSGKVVVVVVDDDNDVAVVFGGGGSGACCWSTHAQ